MKVIEKLAQDILSLAKRPWLGKEKLWKVFWLWGVLLYIVTIIIWSFYAFNPKPLPTFKDCVIFFILLIWFLPILICTMIRKNINNIDIHNFLIRRAIQYFVLSAPIIFSSLNLIFSFTIIGASYMWSGSNLIHLLAGAIIFILIAWMNYEFYKAVVIK